MEGSKARGLVGVVEVPAQVLTYGAMGPKHVGMSELRFVEANALRFGYFEEGTGPLVVLLHGFPDTAHSWEPTRRVLAGAGYRAVSPFMRGYFPTEVPQDGKYDSETLGQDVLALIEALGERSAIVVGHDWGAFAAMTAAQLDPAKVKLLAIIAVPHSASVRPLPRIAWGLRHFVPLKFYANAKWLNANDGANVDELVKRWSPAWSVGPETTAKVKEVFLMPGCAEAALAYYRAVSPLLSDVVKRKIAVPTVAFFGETDSVMKAADFEYARKFHSSSYELVSMPGGHFMHREDPDLFNEHLLAALRKYEA